MKINYCLPIIKNSKDDVLEMISKHKHEYDFFEVWIDYVDKIDTNFISQLSEELREKLIILFRRKNLEPIQINLEKRLEIVSFLEDTDAMLDIDIAQKEELEHIKDNNLKIKKIISYHNYEETPESKKLSEIIDTMDQHSPNIVKISTFCKTEKDAIRLLDLGLELRDKNIKHIILGMGEKSLLTRIFGTLYGNEMVFVPKTLDEQSAEGQLTKDDMEKVFSIIHNS